LPLLVEEYSFGRLKLGGRVYTKDIIFTPQRVLDDSWWRAEGHRLAWSDISRYVEEAKPGVVVVGTGSSGRMRVGEDVVEALRGLGLELVAAPTGYAVKVYNKLALRGENVMAALHLTC